VLLTRSPLGHLPEGRASLDLHVLSTPPAFVLSQDQTLRECLYDSPVTRLCRHRKSQSWRLFQSLVIRAGYFASAEAEDLLDVPKESLDNRTEAVVDES
jgi:hypothetical protein